MEAEIRLLGTVEVAAGGRILDAGHPRQCTVLAALAVDCGRVVPWATLVDRVWGDCAPAHPRDSMRAYVTRLRRVVTAADGAVVHRAGGYLLDVPAERVDLHRFLAFTAAPRIVPAGTRVEQLRCALELWRGEPLTGLTGDWPARMRRLWRQRYLAAAVALAEAELEIGEPASSLASLTELADEHPLDEPLQAAVMRALRATGAPASALARYESLRRSLREELGTDPGDELQELHREILTGRTAEDPAPVRLPRVARIAGPPAMLPVDVAAFVGRHAELAALDRLLAADDATTVTVSVVCGTAGVGKTTLAVHWAHRVRGRFPDGQLYLNLRGFDVTGPPMSEAEAVRVLLDALAVPRERIPAGLTEQIGLYRSLVADRRMLVVLDNARDAAQVRALIPGASASRVVITSRNPLVGLVTEGAGSVPLDILGPPEATELLAHRVGRDRVRDEPAAVTEILEHCSGLPLALALAAARLTVRSRSTFGDLATELRRAADPLAVMETGDDPSTDLRHVFSVSFLTVSAPAQRTFRLLGVHPGPHLPTAAVASLTGRRPEDAAGALAELERAGLVTQVRSGVFAMHDLLRAYARHLAGHEPAPERTAALHRVLDHYLGTAVAADRQLEPQRDPIDVPPPAAGTILVAVESRADALAWFAEEQPVLIRAVEQALAAGFDVHAWQLAWALVEYADLRGDWYAYRAVQETALTAARRLGDLVAEARILRYLANAGMHLDDLGSADRHLREALALCERTGDGVLQATTHLNLSVLRERQERLADANQHAEAALRLFRAAGHRVGEGVALNSLGYGYGLVGDLPAALDCCREALQIDQELGHRKSEAHTADSLGFIHARLGDHARAARFFAHALGLFRDFDDRYNQADALLSLGDAQAAGGERAAAERSWHEAAEILHALEHPRADEARRRLAGADH